VSDLDLDALEATALAQAAAYSKMLELDGGVGLLGVRHPDMFEDMMAWGGSSENEHADTTLALIARIREAEAENRRLTLQAAESEHARRLAFEAKDRANAARAEAEAVIEAALFATDNLDVPVAEPVAEARRILTRHQDKRENGSQDA
jgi:hypothetical protein